MADVEVLTFERAARLCYELHSSNADSTTTTSIQALLQISRQTAERLVDEARQLEYLVDEGADWALTSRGRRLGAEMEEALGRSRTTTDVRVYQPFTGYLPLNVPDVS